jgi:predicted Zn finger-like uncharacterized protein
MPEVVTCPKCERQLRVPDELIGQRVKCPTCGTNFTATVGGSPPDRPEDYQNAPTGNQPEAVQTYREDSGSGPQAEQRHARALASVKVPAICLLIVSVIGLLCDGFNFIRALTVPPPKAEDVIRVFPGFKGQEKELEEQLKMMSGPVLPVIAAVFLVLCIVTLFGSLAMLAGRMRWLGILGSIAAMINLGSCCCVLGLPLGIWSLVVLLRDDVKNAFH